MTERIQVGTTNRTYRLHLPAPSQSQGRHSLPLMLVLHGAFSSAREMEKISGFSELADREGFVVAYPNGIGLLGWLRHWNAGFCCGRAMRAGWDDMAFLLQLIEAIPKILPIDKQRIYLVGMSNGGMLAHRFAAEHPEKLAAFTLASAAVGARWQGETEMLTIAPPSQGVPVLILHARDDETIPLEGGRSKSRLDVEFLGPKDASDFWHKGNGCALAPAEHFRVPQGQWTRWSSCSEDAEVAMLIADQGGHNWSRQQFHPHSVELSTDWATVAWQFMSRFSRPTGLGN